MACLLTIPAPGITDYTKWANVIQHTKGYIENRILSDLMMEDDERPHHASLSEMGCNRGENERHTINNENTKWVRLMEQQNQNFMALIKAMKAPTSSKDTRLPEFDPEKDNVDVRAWISTVDMCITDPDMQGAPLMLALSRALKGQASVWLSQVSFHGMTWSNFKDLFTARYERAETAAGFLINLQNSRPKDSECLASYAAPSMSSIMSNWKNLSVEQIAVSTVLSHISQFDSRVQRSFTQNITTRNELQQQLKAVSFMKRKSPSSNESNQDTKKPRVNSDVSFVKCYVCGKTGHKAVQCRSRKGLSNQDGRFKTPTSDMKTSSSSSPGCFSCGAVGHFAKSCPRRSGKESNANDTAGSWQEKRLNVCHINAPAGTLRHADTILYSAYCNAMLFSQIWITLIRCAEEKSGFWSQHSYDFMIYFLWLGRSLLLISILATNMENFYIAMENSENIVVRTLQSDKCRERERRILKNILRLYRSQFCVARVYGIFSIDARLPLQLTSLISTYIVVLLQFAFL